MFRVGPHIIEGEAREFISKGSSTSAVKRLNIASYDLPCTSLPLANNDPCATREKDKVKRSFGGEGEVGEGEEVRVRAGRA